MDESNSAFERQHHGSFDLALLPVTDATGLELCDVSSNAPKLRPTRMETDSVTDFSGVVATFRMVFGVVAVHTGDAKIISYDIFSDTTVEAVKLAITGSSAHSGNKA